MPEPRKNEGQQDFLDRCMSDPVMEKEFPNNKQRVAVCLNKWRGN